MNKQSGETISTSIADGNRITDVGGFVSVGGNEGEKTGENSSKNEDEKISFKEVGIKSSNRNFFTPHPPEIPKDASQRSPRRLKSQNSKLFERQIQREDSKGSNSDEDRLAHRKEVFKQRTSSSKLPPINRKDSECNDIVPFLNGESTSGEESAKLNAPVLNLKPLSPIKDHQKMIEDFKSMQSLERERQHDKGKFPLKPLKPNEGVSNLAINSNTSFKTKNLIEHADTDSKNLDDLSDSTLTSVSSQESGVTDSDDESSQTTEEGGLGMPYYPHVPSAPPPNYLRRNSLSLTSVRDLADSFGRHSDSEAIRRERKEKRRSTKELWDKAKIINYLPRVPASRARDRNSNFIQEELEKYLPERKLMVFVGTWNMHGEKQLPVFVDDFLLPECCQFMQDLYVIGTQESTPLRKEWEIKLQEALGPSHVMIYSCAFGVLHLAMYLRRELVWFCSAVEQATVATRPGHMIKTKGAIGLTLSVFGTSFLFINSHFTAHEQKWKERIGDYRIIRKTLSLPLNYKETPSRTTDVTSRFHQVFWFGDFNFRVEERHGVVEKFLRQCQDDEDPCYDELVAKDQMTKLMSKDLTSIRMNLEIIQKKEFPRGRIELYSEVLLRMR